MAPHWDWPVALLCGLAVLAGGCVGMARKHSVPSLIGGVRIKLGSDVWDGSISARLAALQKAI